MLAILNVLGFDHFKYNSTRMDLGLFRRLDRRLQAEVGVVNRRGQEVNQQMHVVGNVSVAGVEQMPLPADAVEHEG